MPVPIRRLVVALTLSCALIAGGTACTSGANAKGAKVAIPAAATATPSAPAKTSSPSASGKTASPSATAQKQKLAKTRFVANAGLAAGATYQWIYKPWKAGKFKKGASGRKFTLIKAGLAGAFAYNRLKAALKNAQGDPTLSKAVAPLAAGIESLKDLPAKLRKGDSTDAVANTFNDIINQVKDAGKSAGAEVKNQVPSGSQLTGG
ncbi:hypothetical protein [Streptomyces sp. Tue6028]|uniref:hypothetical protein n=1 Tax=Streptomyces sp. Tue6028 TaxID=2036037 RepID=UPI003D70B1B2